MNKYQIRFLGLIALACLLAENSEAQNPAEEMRRQAKEMCNMHMNLALGLQDQAAQIKDGKLVVDQKSPSYVSSDGADKVRIKMPYER